MTVRLAIKIKKPAWIGTVLEVRSRPPAQVAIKWRENLLLLSSRALKVNALSTNRLDLDQWSYCHQVLI